MKPVSARLPVSETSRSNPTAASISAHSAAVRWSFQRIAGRSTRSAASSATSPCIWPEKPIAVWLAADRRERALRRRPPVLWILLGPARLRRRQRVLLLRLGDDDALLVDRNRLDAGRPDVEPDERHAALIAGAAARPARDSSQFHNLGLTKGRGRTSAVVPRLRKSKIWLGQSYLAASVRARSRTGHVRARVS